MSPDKYPSASTGRTHRVHLRLLFVFASFIWLTACGAEQNYRGVPSPYWQELTGEQKQLVIDQAYEQDMTSAPKKTEATNT